MLRYIFGKAGTGKTARCAAEITAAQRPETVIKTSGGLIYVVPEQFSLSSERLLLDAAEGRGLFGAQVLSFNRLAYNVLREVGRGGLLPLDDMGKHILIRKALNAVAKRLVYYKNIAPGGFVDKLGALITEFYQYGIKPADLLAAASNEPNSPYALRLADLGVIFAAYQHLTEGRLTADSTLDLLADRVGESPALRGAKLWIDGFKSFTPQEYRVLAACLRVCGEVSVALPMDMADPDAFDGFFHYIGDHEPFAEVKRTVNALTRMAADGAVAMGRHIYLAQNHRHRAFPALHDLLESYFTPGIMSKTVDGVMLSRHYDVYGELDFAARRMVELARDHGYKYSDMGVVATDLNMYAAPMQIVFARYGISLFVDDRRDLSGHPLAVAARAALLVAKNGYSYDNILGAIKTGLFGIKADEADELENYVLACGIKGWQWEREWHFVVDGDQDQRERADALRLKLLEDFSHFTRHKKSKNPITLCKALYDFLVNSGVKGRLEDWISAAKIGGELESSSLHSQVWARLMEVLDIICALFEGDRLDLDDFLSLLDSAFLSVSAGVAPPSLDHVIAGDIRRSRLTEVRALFMLGMNDCFLPGQKDEGLIPDADREALKARGVDMAPSRARQAADERLNIYLTLAKPTRRLYLSYLAEENWGPASFVLKDIRAKLPIAPHPAPTAPEVTNWRAMIHSLHENLRHSPDAVSRAVYTILSADERTAGIITRLDALKTRPEERLYERDIAALYGDAVRSTVSKLEAYRRCPFMHFAEDCLNLRERRLYEIENHDVGSILHLILERFTPLLNDVSASQLSEIVSNIVEETAAEYANAILLGEGRYAHYKERLKAAALASARAMLSHKGRGDFRVAAYETAFGPLSFDIGGKSLELTGRIDRIDACDKDGRRYLSVIDYKTGRSGFSFASLLHGTQLQLALYLTAALEKHPGALAAGFFYFKVANPVVEYGDGMDTAAALLAKFRMSGVVSSDLDVIHLLDKDAGAGDMLPVALTGGGTGISKRSLTLDNDGFNALMATAAAQITDIGRSLLAGHFPSAPLKHKGHLPCSYCSYKPLCGTPRPRYAAKIGERDAYEKIKTLGLCPKPRHF